MRREVGHACGFWACQTVATLATGRGPPCAAPRSHRFSHTAAMQQRCRDQHAAAGPRPSLPLGLLRSLRPPHPCRYPARPPPLPTLQPPTARPCLTTHGCKGLSIRQPRRGQEPLPGCGGLVHQVRGNDSDGCWHLVGIGAKPRGWPHIRRGSKPWWPAGKVWWCGVVGFAEKAVVGPSRGSGSPGEQPTAGGTPSTSTRLVLACAVQRVTCY